jgi:hypothetical protein
MELSFDESGDTEDGVYSLLPSLIDAAKVEVRCGDGGVGAGAEVGERAAVNFFEILEPPIPTKLRVLANPFSTFLPVN